MTGLCVEFDRISYGSEKTEDPKIESAEKARPAMFPETEESWLDKDNVDSNIGECKWVSHCCFGDLKMTLCGLDEYSPSGCLDRTSTEDCV